MLTATRCCRRRKSNLLKENGKIYSRWYFSNFSEMEAFMISQMVDKSSLNYAVLASVK